MPLFFEPNLDANINIKIAEKLLFDKDNVYDLDDDEYYPHGAFLMQKLPIYSEYEALVANLPQNIRDKYVNRKYKKLSCWATSNKITIDVQHDVKKTLQK